MMMKRWIVCLFLVSPTWVFSQFYFYDDNYLDPAILLEAGFGAGAMSCKTDLGKKAFLPPLKEVQGAVTFIARMQWHRGLALKCSYTAGRVSASDSLIKVRRKGDLERKKRNLHFFSAIREVACSIEWFPYPGLTEHHLTQPYIAIGAGYFQFSPKGEIKGQRIELASLSTEGSITQPYKLQQFNIIAGIGVRFEWNARISSTLAFEHRFLFTDHLDDVSGRFIDPARQGSQLQETGEKWLKEWYKLSDPLVSKPGDIRGNPSKKDSYSTLMLTVALALNRKRLD